MKNFSKQPFWHKYLVTSHFLLVETTNFTHASSAVLGLIYHTLCMLLCLSVQLFINPSTLAPFPLPLARGSISTIHQLKPFIALKGVSLQPGPALGIADFCQRNQNPA